jgi:hypothetical protein
MNYIEQNHIIENPEFTKTEIEEIIIMTRLYLYNRGVCCGAKAIKRKLEEEYHIDPSPSERTIGRILSKHCLTHRRTGFYEEDYI